MTFWRIGFIGVILAAISAAVIQIRLMNASASRQIHLLIGQQQTLQRRIWRQELELAQLRAPWKVADRLQTIGMELAPPGAKRDKGPSRTVAAEPPSVPTRLIGQQSRSGGTAAQWPSRPPQNPTRSKTR